MACSSLLMIPLVPPFNTNQKETKSRLEELNNYNIGKQGGFETICYRQIDRYVDRLKEKEITLKSHSFFWVNHLKTC